MTGVRRNLVVGHGAHQESVLQSNGIGAFGKREARNNHLNRLKQSLLTKRLAQFIDKSRDRMIYGLTAFDVAGDGKTPSWNKLVRFIQRLSMTW